MAPFKTHLFYTYTLITTMPEVFNHTRYGLPAPNTWQVAEITNGLEPKDLIRTQRDVTSLILAAIQEEPEGKTAGANTTANLRHYDGLRSKYNLSADETTSLRRRGVRDSAVAARRG